MSRIISPTPSEPLLPTPRGLVGQTISLPAISLWQPWASLPFAPTHPKRHETRHWAASQRIVGKRVLIHAAKTNEGLRDIDSDLERLCLALFPANVRPLPRGAFVGTVILGQPFPMREGVHRYGAADETDLLCGNWCPGRWAWPLLEPQPFARPIPAKGQQGWWMAEIPAEAMAGLLWS